MNLLVQRNVPVTFVPPPDPDPDAADPDAQPSPSPAAAQPGMATIPSTKKTTVKRAQLVHKPGTALHHEFTVRRAIPISSPSPQL